VLCTAERPSYLFLGISVLGTTAICIIYHDDVNSRELS
jgi:hypothetical protein